MGEEGPGRQALPASGLHDVLNWSPSPSLWDPQGKLSLFSSSLVEGGSQSETRVHERTIFKVSLSTQRSSWTDSHTPTHLPSTFFMPGQLLVPVSHPHLISLWTSLLRTGRERAAAAPATRDSGGGGGRERGLTPSGRTSWPCGWGSRRAPGCCTGHCTAAARGPSPASPSGRPGAAGSAPGCSSGSGRQTHSSLEAGGATVVWAAAQHGSPCTPLP